MTAVTLVEFLLARIAEDEQTARRAALHLERNPSRLYDGTPPEWVAHVRGVGSPERVARECAAKRHIVEMHEEHRSRVMAYRSPRWADVWTDADKVDHKKAEARHRVSEDVLHALAAPYADHPDYDEAWRA